MSFSKGRRGVLTHVGIWGLITLFLVPTFTYAQTQSQLVSTWIESIETEDILFSLGTTTLNEPAREQLNLISGKLAQLFGDYVVEVTGHTDDQGDADNNLRLSHLRALSVVTYLSQKNLHHQKFLVQSKGEFFPTVSNATEQGRAQNRRVEIAILPSPGATLSLMNMEDPESIEEVSLLAQIEPEEEDFLDDSQSIESMAVEEENLDDVTSDESPDESMIEETSAEEEAVEDPSDVVFEEAPLNTTEPKKTIQPTEAKFFLSSNPRERRKPHVYDERKRTGTGTSYVFVGPVWTRLSNLDDFGQSDAVHSSQMGLYTGGGWTTFLEDEQDVFVTLAGFARYERFDDAPASGFVDSQSEWTYGGDITIGKYLFDDFSVAARVGFASHTFLRQNGANVAYESDFIGNVGADFEFIPWRFSSDGNVGLKAHVYYYDVPLGDLDSGWQYGGALFSDFKRYRLTIGYELYDMEALGIDSQYSRFFLQAAAYF